MRAAECRFLWESGMLGKGMCSGLGHAARDSVIREGGDERGASPGPCGRAAHMDRASEGQLAFWFRLVFFQNL